MQEEEEEMTDLVSSSGATPKMDLETGGKMSLPSPSKVVSRMPSDARTHSSDGAGYTSFVDANDVILRGLRNGSPAGRVEPTRHDLKGAVDTSTYPKEIVSNAVLSCDVPSFYSTFWSQHSGFLTRHLTDRKCSDIKCSAWNRLNSAANSFAREVI